MIQTFWKNGWQFLKHATTIQSSNCSLPSCLLQRNKDLFPHKTCTQMFSAALFITVPTWEQLRCPSVGEQLAILWWIHIMDCCSGRAPRINWVQSITWVHIQTIKLSGKAYSKSLHIVWFHLYNSHERTKQKWRTNWWLPGFKEGMGHERRGCGDRSIAGDILVVMKMSVSWLCQCQYPDYDLGL